MPLKITYEGQIPTEVEGSACYLCGFASSKTAWRYLIQFRSPTGGQVALCHHCSGAVAKAHAVCAADTSDFVHAP